METKDSNQFYSEKLICIDPVFINLTPPEKPKINLNKLDFGLSENNNIYCCPQTLFKIHPEFDLALAKIVEKDSKAQIVMIETKQKVLVDKLKIRWSRNFPVLNKKVTFLKSMSLDKFLSLIEISNVLLDPFYFGGGLSFAETLVVGTPTVTMPTKFMRSRVTSGLYKQMKIPNPPIARNVEEYVELATELAKNTKKNYELRKLLQRAAKIHLFNNSKSLKQFEKVLIESYQIQKKGLSLKDGYVI
jgi:predicted O-linked N-acetylglucosamine transferase (SPINDLY family)